MDLHVMHHGLLHNMFRICEEHYTPYFHRISYSHHIRAWISRRGRYLTSWTPGDIMYRSLLRKSASGVEAKSSFILSSMPLGRLGYRIHRLHIVGDAQPSSLSANASLSSRASSARSSSPASSPTRKCLASASSLSTPCRGRGRVGGLSGLPYD